MILIWDFMIIFKKKIDILNEYSKIKPIRNYVACLIKAIQEKLETKYHITN